jgi:hypothetical protein
MFFVCRVCGLYFYGYAVIRRNAWLAEGESGRERAAYYNTPSPTPSPSPIPPASNSPPLPPHTTAIFQRIMCIQYVPKHLLMFELGSGTLRVKMVYILYRPEIISLVKSDH